MREETELTPAQRLQGLLARSRNPFDVSDATLERLERSVVHEVAPDHGHPQYAQLWDTGEPWWGCFRHVFLLRDGSSELLWELCYEDRDGDGQLLSEVYEREHEMRQSERRVHRGGGAPGEVFADGGAFGELYGGARDDAYGDDGTGEANTRGEPEVPGGTTPFGLVPQAAWLPRQRGYTEHDSPDHARRLLRRAENEDRPGADILRLLAGAQGHEIVHVPRPHALVREWHIWCSLYQHAFLLADGSELSLYELEHDLTGSGRLVCEVYLEEVHADRAAHRHARERGFEL